MKVVVSPAWTTGDRGIRRREVTGQTVFVAHETCGLVVQAKSLYFCLPPPWAWNVVADEAGVKLPQPWSSHEGLGKLGLTHETVCRGTHLVFSHPLNKHAFSACSGQVLCQAPRIGSKGGSHLSRLDWCGVVPERADMVGLISSLKIPLLDQPP